MEYEDRVRGFRYMIWYSMVWYGDGRSEERGMRGVAWCGVVW